MRTRIPAVLAALFLTVSAAALQAQQDTTKRDTTVQDTTRRATTQAKPDSTQPVPVQPVPVQPVPVQPAPVTPAPTEAAPAAPAPAPAAAPATAGVRPGMTEADVRQQWGEPVTVRRRNEWTYMFYTNGHERRLGYYDTVFLQNGQVVDAIVRSPDHVYLGVSSSPEGRVPQFTPPQHAAPADSTRQPAEVGGVRVNSPAQPAPSRPED